MLTVALAVFVIEKTPVNESGRNLHVLAGCLCDALWQVFVGHMIHVWHFSRLFCSKLDHVFHQDELPTFAPSQAFIVWHR